MVLSILDQIIRCRISGGGISHAFDFPAIRRRLRVVHARGDLRGPHRAAEDPRLVGRDDRPRDDAVDAAGWAGSRNRRGRGDPEDDGACGQLTLVLTSTHEGA